MFSYKALNSLSYASVFDDVYKIIGIIRRVSDDWGSYYRYMSFDGKVSVSVSDASHLSSHLKILN